MTVFYGVVLIILGSIYAFTIAKGSESYILRILLSLLGVPTIGEIVCFLISRRHEKWADAIGPISFLPSCAILIYISHTQFNDDSIDVSAKNGMSYVIWFLYLVYVGILQTTFLPHLIVRSVSLLVTLFYFQWRRVNIGELKPTTFIFVVLLWLFIEFIFYVNNKASAKLFLSLRSGVM